MKKEKPHKYLALGILSPASPKPKVTFNERLLLLLSLFRQGNS